MIALPLHQPDIPDIAALVRDLARPALGWVYRQLADHLHAGKQDQLSYAQIAHIVGGMSADTCKRHLMTLVDEGLITRYRVGNGAYTWAIGGAKPPPREGKTTPTPTKSRGQIYPFEGAKPPPREGKTTPQYDVYDDAQLDREIGEVSVTDKPTTEQRQVIAALDCMYDHNRAYLVDEPLLAYADAMTPDAVQAVITQHKAYLARANSAPAALFKLLREANKPRTTKPNPVPATDKYTAFVDDGTAPKPVVQATPPSGPVIAPEPSVPPQPPPAAEDPTITRARAALVAAYARTCPGIQTATLTRNGDAWTISAPPDTASRINAMHRYLHATLRDGVGAASLAVEATS